MSSYSLNSYVTVTLTENGRETWNRYWNGSEWSAKEINDAGRLRAQLWVIMRVFGEHLLNGGEMPMAPEIELESEGTQS